MYVQKEKWNGKTTYELDYRERSKWSDTLRQAFVAFSRYSTLPVFEAEINAVIDEFSAYGKLTMPTTWTHSQVRLKIFTNKVELTLSRNVAEQLQLFLGAFLD